MRRFGLSIVVLAVAGFGLTACSSNRWCEFDATDQVVADSYCEKNTPGYEWEDDSSSKSKKKKKSKSSSKTGQKH
ncbi:hypothetical protein [Actinocorallia sp. A-T 12471]|uniref:hypothetical protein n=1 Tax=Actinocorallia sp. A-T 12471 TaxID=3089813 RepID=UPI0029CB243C|nr:hypothetical protein [Actinocorallia sp. A-T 12471]MDX6742626.1 hypothetical protein [Actinocorallia sp. A-T 12471]